jgi:hypothetical protein
MSTTQFTRLPSNVLPVNYNLELTPNISNFTFQGRVVIDVNVIQSKIVFIFRDILNLKINPF